MWSKSFRELLRRYYGVEVGIHSYGPCLWPGHLPEGTIIGNYCSLAAGIQVLRRNHTMDHISQHPFFFNSALGFVEQGLIHEVADNPLVIGHDVWIGQDAMITPGCRTIGNASVVAAGAVVASDVPAFAVVGGVPAKLIRWRFPQAIREVLTRSQWWLKPACDLAENFVLFTERLSSESADKLEKAMKVFSKS